MPVDRSLCLLLRMSAVTFSGMLGGLIAALLFGSTLWAAADQITFETDRDGNREIYLLDIRTGLTYNVTRHPAHDYGPASILADGQIIYYADYDGDFSAELYTISASTGIARRIFTEGGSASRPVWSPDGKRVVFIRNYADIRILDMSTGEERDLRYGFGPQWSPDGAQVILYADRPNDLRADIFAIDVDNYRSYALTNHPANDWSPAWSPDGKWIAFVSARSGNAEIYVMDAQCDLHTCEETAYNLTHSPHDDFNPSWSPDSQWIAFHSDRTGSNHIYLINQDGSRLRKLTSGGANNQFAVWRPVGN